MRKPRLVCWYSKGAASLMAAKLAIALQPSRYPGHEVVVAYIFIEDEVKEPAVLEQAAKFLGQEILIVRDTKYSASVDEVIKKTRYMSGPNGARCTKELKKQVRYDWQRDDDVHVFGMDCNEKHRIDGLIDNEPEVNFYAPLVELNVTKAKCLEVMTGAGMELPLMYRLGYHNNNCPGCLKAAGAGYWNKIRVDFPPVFEKRVAQSDLLGVTLVRLSKTDVIKYGDGIIIAMESDGIVPKEIGSDGRMRIPLRYLPPKAGTHKDLDIGDCGFFCESKE